MKIYTKTGDSGQTALYGGKRVSKSELRIETYGSVDELNAWLGLIASHALHSIDVEFIRKVQSDLFNIGAILAATPEKKLKLPSIKEKDIHLIEEAIDRTEENLEPLSNFVLPGGSSEASHCHLARTVCRRAERRVVELNAKEPVDKLIITYLNRLSDYLFVLSRLILKEQGKPEIPWKS